MEDYVLLGSRGSGKVVKSELKVAVQEPTEQPTKSTSTTQRVTTDHIIASIGVVASEPSVPATEHYEPSVHAKRARGGHARD